MNERERQKVGGAFDGLGRPRLRADASRFRVHPPARERGRWCGMEGALVTAESLRDDTVLLYVRTAGEVPLHLHMLVHYTL